MNARILKLSLNFLLFFLPISVTLLPLLTTRLNFPFFTYLWKELLLSLTTLYILFVSFKINFANKFSFSHHKFVLIAICASFIVLTSSFIYNEPLSNILLGFRFELFWLINLAILIDFSFLSKKYGILSLDFYNKLISKKAVFIPFLYILVLCVLQFVTNGEVFKYFGLQQGWEASTLNSNLIQSPFCNTISSESGFCRATGGFASPNHLAGYLVFVFFYSFSLIFETVKKSLKTRLFYLFCVTSSSILLALTFSRFVFIGLFVVGSFYLIIGLKKLVENSVEFKKLSLVCKRSLSVIQMFALVSPLIILLFSSFFAQIYINNTSKIFNKSASTLEHQALKTVTLEVIETKTKSGSLIFSGYGITATGTAAKPQYQNTVLSKYVIENTEIAKKYNIPPYTITIPESWFFQIYLNGGLIYFILYFTVALLGFIYTLFYSNWGQRVNLNLWSLYVIIVGNVFLHIWESQVVVYYYLIFSFILISTSNTIQNSLSKK